MDFKKPLLTASTTVAADINRAWELWTDPAHIKEWNSPSPEWLTSFAEADVRTGGTFRFTMETRDGRVRFDHAGTYDEIVIHKLIRYTGVDGRKTIIQFFAKDGMTQITEDFEPDDNPPLQVQQEFCQGVLDTFKRYAEQHR